MGVKPHEMAAKRILVAGAGGALGQEIARLLRAQSHRVVATIRTPRAVATDRLHKLGAQIVRLDLTDAAAVKEQLETVDSAIFTPILTISAGAASLLAKKQPAVFFSSNNVAIDPKAEIYARLSTAEHVIRAAAPHAVILRPTMIYGYPGDGNLSRLMTAMRRIPATPLPGAGTALQQPVYYKDLAAVAAGALFDGAARGATRAVAGPEPVTQRDLYNAVARATGRRARIFRVPVAFAAEMLKWAEKAGLRPPVSSAQLRRAGIDKTPTGDAPILTPTPLNDGLAALADALDADRAGA